MQRLLAIPILLLTFGDSAAGPRTGPNTRTLAPRPTVDQILERYAQAVGGELAFRKVTTRAARGTLEVQRNGERTFHGTFQIDAKAQNKLLLRVTIQTNNDATVVFARGFDGLVGWERSGPGAACREISGPQLATQRRAADFYREIRLKQAYRAMSLIGEKQVETRRVYVIEAIPPDGAAERLYFDVRSGLLVRVEGFESSLVSQSPTTTWLEDYREVDGIRLPFVVRYANEARTDLFRFEEVRHNVALEDALFTAEDPALAAATTDEYIRAEMTRRRIPGLALAVIKKGEIAKEQGYGLASLEHDVPVGPDTVFELASLTKQFTATAIVLLAERGKLGLDDPVARHIPSSPPAWKGITLRHLLTHTSGLAGGFEESLYRRTDLTRDETLASVVKRPLFSRPGERYRYSDPGYFLLGVVIETASGQSYRDFLAQQLFGPLGMTSTAVIDQWTIVKHRAAGYTIRGGRLVNIRRIWQDEVPSHWGALSTARDLARWDAALAGGRIVNQASLMQMWTALKLADGGTFPYGFGWFLGDLAGHRAVFHAGASGTEYYRLPDDGWTVIVLTNLGHAEGADSDVDSWGIATGVARRLLAALP